MGDGQATEAERQLQVSLKQAKAVANRSEEHKVAVRSIATQQPIAAREADGFLALLA